MLDPLTQKRFDEQRYDRLKEVISEYLDDDGGSAAKLLQDIERAALENSQYFVGRVDEYTHLRDFFS
jgi:hypothetical protein